MSTDERPATTVQLGVVADDITGACDVAAGVWEAGMPVEVRLGVPQPSPPPTAPCVVVALKSRTAPAAVAVAESLAAYRVLRGWGARRIYQKYCSTFDSTDAGNIGPVADAFLDAADGAAGNGAIALATPVTPAAGRTMHRGHLFVGDTLLSESSLARHPLTPMRDANLVRVLSRQTPRAVASLPIEDVRAGAQAVVEAVARLRAGGVRHVLADAVEDADLDVLAAAADDIPNVVLSGAAGLITALARRSTTRGGPEPAPPPPAGRRLVLSGSGSERTREQVAAFPGPVMHLDVDRLADEPGAVVADALQRIRAADPILVSATADPDRVAETQARWGAERAAAMIEEALARIAAAAVADAGVRRILVAGGETSGAVAAGLRLGPLTVRRVVAPGVPWMSAEDAAGRRLDVCFKSGNFGQRTLFDDAWQEAPK